MSIFRVFRKVQKGIIRHKFINFSKVISESFHLYCKNCWECVEKVSFGSVRLSFTFLAFVFVVALKTINFEKGIKRLSDGIRSLTFLNGYYIVYIPMTYHNNARKSMTCRGRTNIKSRSSLCLQKH